MPSRTDRDFSSRGFTLIELTMVITMFVVLVTVLLPVIQRSRERARRAQCARNLRLIALACQQYENSFGCFPMGRSQQPYVDTPGYPLLGYYTGWSFHAATLIYTEDSAAFHAINFSLGPYQLRNNTVSGTAHDFLWCPSDREIIGRTSFIDQPDAWDRTTLTVTYTNYGGFTGTFGFAEGGGNQLMAQDGMFPEVGLPRAQKGPGTRPPVRVDDVSDGLAQTLLLGERAHGKLSRYNCSSLGHCSFLGHGWWASSDYGDASISAFYRPNFTAHDLYGTHALDDPGSPTARCDGATPFATSASSFHPGGANFSFADGSVRFLRDTIGSWDYQSVARSLNSDCIPSVPAPLGVYQQITTRSGEESVDDLEHQE